jgi:actin related protein 2/3 complex subunit 1A/1B
MSGKTVSSFGTSPISTHSWSEDGNYLALSCNNKDVEIIHKAKEEGKWIKTARLQQHDLLVTGIDWAPKTNRIVTCSEDRNAYVWNLEAGGTWKQTLVLLRINRAATCVKWSPNENKFAIGSGSRLISVCYLDAVNDWWVAKHIKNKIRSTVTSIDWHPNNCLIAAGTTGYKVRVFSGHINDIEEKPNETRWGNEMKFHTLMAEFSNSFNGGGWIHSVCFSDDGNRLAWVAHDSSISVVDVTKSLEVYKLKTQHLPFLSCVWASPDIIIAAGHGCIPVVFKINGSGQIEVLSNLEEKQDYLQERSFSFRDRLEGMVDVSLNTTHQSQISCIRILRKGKDQADKISTSGGDGKVVVWDLRDIEKRIPGLGI